MRLKDRVAIVTAAAGAGIGKATAKKFAEEGATVIVTDNHERRTKETADELKSEFGEDKIIGIKCDVTNKKDVDSMAKQVLDKFGRVDILINNAGREILDPVEKIKDKDWDIVIDCNLKGMFFCTKAVIPAMIEQKYGRIINLASIAVWIGSPIGETSYSAAKAGMVGFANSLSREVGQYGITINNVAPGIIPNPFLDKIYPPGMLNAAAKSSPVKRGGKPEEVANLIAFLASEEAGYIVGETIDINGGLYMR